VSVKLNFDMTMIFPRHGFFQTSSRWTIIDPDSQQQEEN